MNAKPLTMEDLPVLMSHVKAHLDNGQKINDDLTARADRTEEWQSEHERECSKRFGGIQDTLTGLVNTVNIIDERSLGNTVFKEKLTSGTFKSLIGLCGGLAMALIGLIVWVINLFIEGKIQP